MQKIVGMEQSTLKYTIKKKFYLSDVGEKQNGKILQ